MSSREFDLLRIKEGKKFLGLIIRRLKYAIMAWGVAFVRVLS